MRIVITAAGMVRVVVLCFVLGIAVGVYFGVAGSPSVVPTVERPVEPVEDHSVDLVAPVAATAP